GRAGQLGDAIAEPRIADGPGAVDERQERQRSEARGLGALEGRERAEVGPSELGDPFVGRALGRAEARELSPLAEQARRVGPDGARVAGEANERLVATE